MKKYPSVSIIIPLYVIVDRFFEDFKKYKNLNYPNYEIIVVCDRKVNLPDIGKPVRFFLTKKKNTGPAEKRDLAMKYVKGDISAFIDDDAYPDKRWLKQAVKHFKNKKIAAVGGPGVTPPDNTFLQKIGGYIIESYLCSGDIQIRFYPGASTLSVNDYPAYNLFVRTNILKKVGGYGSTFYGGEDTLFCMKIIKYGKILYDPKVVVYHHRREFPLSLLRQIAGVGLHRGYFFKRYPETSRTFLYLMPTILTTGLVFSMIVILLYPRIFFIPVVILFAGFLSLGAFSVYRHHVPVLLSLIAGFGIIVTHVTYGIYFIKGLFTKKLIR